MTASVFLWLTLQQTMRFPASTLALLAHKQNLERLETIDSAKATVRCTSDATAEICLPIRDAISVLFQGRPSRASQPVLSPGRGNVVRRHAGGGVI